LLFALGLLACQAVSAKPHVKRDEISLQNGNDAIALNAKFKTLTPQSPCINGDIACVNDSYAQCNGGQFTLSPCSPGLVCRASPNRGSLGTTISCMSEAENTMRIIATGANYTSPDPQDPSQSSLALSSGIISAGFQNTGQDNITAPGQAPSQTSSNNWINYCNTVDKALTNGQQVRAGSCNPAPIGAIPSVDNMPSSKFIFPPNFAAVKANETFTVKIAINHLETGWFTNADSTYMAAPIIVNADGDVMGHAHIVVEQLTGFGQTTPTDPRTFTFFKALNDPSVDGVSSIDIAGGLPAGYYRIATFHTGANHQPIAPPIAQRGVMEDMVYFSVI